jgi:peptide chain release factor
VVGPEKGTFHSLVYSLPGQHQPQWLASWIGTIKWICASPFRENHGRKNWYVGVQLLQQPELGQWDLDDIKVEAFRSSGPGGQNVNKVASAVRVTHIPTGIQVAAQDERSQHQNKSLAIERLKRRLQAEDDRSRNSARQELWSQHNQLMRGNPVRVYSGSGPDFRRVQ